MSDPMVPNPDQLSAINTTPNLAINPARYDNPPADTPVAPMIIGAKDGVYLVKP
jgi:hypothetical protein